MGRKTKLFQLIMISAIAISAGNSFASEEAFDTFLETNQHFRSIYENATEEQKIRMEKNWTINNKALNSENIQSQKRTQKGINSENCDVQNKNQNSTFRNNLGSSTGRQGQGKGSKQGRKK